VGVETGPRDSSWTTFRVTGGTGQYATVTRGCEGEVLSVEQRNIRTWGAEVEHKFHEPFLLGLRATRAERTVHYPGPPLTPGGPPTDATVSQDWYVVNPHLAFDSRTFGFGAGYNTITEGTGWPDDFVPSPISGHLRFGPRDRSTLTLRVSESAPLYLPAGIGEITLEFPAFSRARIGIGLGGPEPFDNLGAILRARVRVARGWYVDGAGRLGGSEGACEYAVTAGVTFALERSRATPGNAGPQPAPTPGPEPERAP
jgi:hypothetical protein